MKVITLRIKENIDARIQAFSEENGINNKQEAYRRLLLIGLNNETKFDRSKVISLERETLKELKVIKKMVIDGNIISRDKTNDIDQKVSAGVSKMNIFKEF